MLKTTLFNKKTDKQSYLHEKSDHPVLLKKKYSDSQIRRVKKICSTNSEFNCNCKVLQEQFTKRLYDPSLIKTEIKKIKLLNRKELLTPKATQKTQVLPLTVIYNRVFQYKINNIKSLAHLKGTLRQI